MIFDLIIIILLCLSAVLGFKKGMLVSLFSILCFILSIYLTYILLPHVTNIVGNIIPVQKITTAIVNDSKIFSSIINSNSKLLVVVRYLLHLNDNYLYANICDVLINVICFILLSFLVKFMLKLVFKKLSIALKGFFILGTIDRLCGLGFGFVKGLIFACVISFIITSIVDMNLFSTDLYNIVQDSSLIPVFSNGANYIIKTMTNMVII